MQALVQLGEEVLRDSERSAKGFSEGDVIEAPVVLVSL